MAKVLLAGVIIITVAVAGFWGLKMMKQTSQSASIPNYQAQINPLTRKVTASSNPQSTGLANKKDISNSALDQDFADVQNSLNKLNKDQTEAGTDTSSQDTTPPDTTQSVQ